MRILLSGLNLEMKILDHRTPGFQLTLVEVLKQKVLRFLFLLPRIIRGIFQSLWIAFYPLQKIPVYPDVGETLFWEAALKSSTQYRINLTC